MTNYGFVPKWMLTSNQIDQEIHEVTSYIELKNFINPDVKYVRVVQATGVDFYRDASLDVPVPSGDEPMVIVGTTGRVWQLIPEDRIGLATTQADVATLMADQVNFARKDAANTFAAGRQSIDTSEPEFEMAATAADDDRARWGLKVADSGILKLIAMAMDRTSQVDAIEITRDAGGALKFSFKVQGTDAATFEALSAGLGASTSVVTRQTGDGRYLLHFATRAAAEASHIEPGAKRIYTDAYDENGFGGARYKRVSYADLSPAMRLVTRAWFRSADRYLPDGTIHAVNGGYWIIDEESPLVTMFGGVPDGDIDANNVVIGTDNSAAAQAWIDFYYARGVSDGINQRHFGSMIWGYGRFRISSGLDFTIFSAPARLYTIEGRGATILADCEDEILFDFQDCEYFHLMDFQLYGSQLTPPLCAIRTGRIGNNNTAARWAMTRVSTRVSSAKKSTWKLAAVWDVASETTSTRGCFWENYQSKTPGGMGFAYANDSTNFLGWGEPITVTDITKANPGVVTAAGHGLVNDDIIAFGEITNIAQLKGKLYKVANAGASTFELRHLDNTNVNTSTYATFTAGVVHKRAFDFGPSLSVHANGNMSTSPSRKDWNSTAIPYERLSNKHKVSLNDTYYSPFGRAAIWQGACEDRKYISCFAVGEIAFIFKYEDDTTGFEGCVFDMHLEGGPGNTSHWAEWERTWETQTECKVINCTFFDCALSVPNNFFRYKYDDEDIMLLGGSITISRMANNFVNGARTLTSGPGRIVVFGTTIILDKTKIAGTEVNNIPNFSGMLIDMSNNLAIPRLQPFKLEEMGSTGSWLIDPSIFKWGLVAVSNATGGNTFCWSDGTNWRRYDRAVLS